MKLEGLPQLLRDMLTQQFDIDELTYKYCTDVSPYRGRIDHQYSSDVEDHSIAGVRLIGERGFMVEDLRIHGGSFLATFIFACKVRDLKLCNEYKWIEADSKWVLHRSTTTNCKEYFSLEPVKSKG